MEKSVSPTIKSVLSKLFESQSVIGCFPWPGKNLQGCDTFTGLLLPCKFTGQQSYGKTGANENLHSCAKGSKMFVKWPIKHTSPHASFIFYTCVFI